MTEELIQIVEACEVAASALDPAERTAALREALMPPALITLAQSGDFRAIGRVTRAAATSENPECIGWLTRVICSPGSLPPLLKDGVRDRVIAQLASSSGAPMQRSEMSDPPWKRVLDGVGDTSTIAQRRLRPPRGYALT